MRVLIADDSATSRAVLRSVLTGWGYEVVTARDGQEALDLLAKPDAPPLVILDWVMPHVRGRKFAAGSGKLCGSLTPTSFCLPQRARKSRRWKVWTPGRTTISLSPSTNMNCRCVCARANGLSICKLISCGPEKNFGNALKKICLQCCRTDLPLLRPGAGR